MIAEIIIIALICIILLFAFGLLYLIAPKRVGKNTAFSINQVKFAHRGIHNSEENIPENSLLAFKKAINLGYGIELDIRETKDKKIVVFHDDDLKRMCNDTTLISESTLKELQNYTLLNTNEKIPTLEEVLSLVDGKVPILVEYKADLPGTECSSICTETNELLKGYNGEYAIESFNYLVLGWYKKHMPNILRGQLGMGMQCYEVALGKEKASQLSMKKRRMVTYLLCNYIGRPHFISYRWQDIKLAVKINQILGAKIACWTVVDTKNSQRLIEKYDSIIFEKYLA